MTFKSFPVTKGVPLTQILNPIQDLQPAIERLSIFADDRGAVADGVTDNQSYIQAAIDELYAAGGGLLKFTPGKSYLSSVIYCKPNVTIDLNRATLIAKQSSDNELFAFGVGIGGQTKISISSALQGATSITVSSSSAFVIGERILISAGTFTGSGVEEGPVEYNTVTAKPDGTHITVQTPLRYTYSAFGLPGQTSPGVYRVESFTRGLIHDVRITNGFLKTKAGDNPLYFNGSGERIEVDHLFIDGYGSLILEAGYVNELRFHDSVIKGIGNANGGGINSASMHNSCILNNLFGMADDAGTNGRNGLQLEVTNYGNLIAGNTFGPKRSINGGAVEISLYGFGNSILNNTIWGLKDDISSGVVTLGIRTYANSASALSWMGNIIAGNKITNIMTGIGDSMPESIIDDNTLANETLHAYSTAIVMNTSKGNLGVNSVSGFTKILDDASGGVPRVQRQFGVTADFEGDGSPEGVVTAPPGATYRNRLGGAGTTCYYKESGTGNTGWIGMLSASLGVKNVALAANGATASASSTNSDFLASKAIDGNRKGDQTIGVHSYWNDNTSGVFDDWLEVDFNATYQIGEIDIFTIEDSSTPPSGEPLGTDTFTLYGITDFTVQYWNGSSWVDLQHVTGNNKVWFRLQILGGISTNKIRVVVHDSADHTWSRIAEVEAWIVSNTATVVEGPTGGSFAPTTRSINTSSPLAGGGDLSTDRTLSIQKADATHDGYLSQSDWSTFNNKQAAGSYVLTSDSRLSDSRAPTGSAGGDLSGSYPNPALANIPNDVPMAGDVLATNIAAPSTPASGKTRIYVDSTSKNIVAKNDAGTKNHGVQTKASASHQFLTAIDDDGTVHAAQPAAADLSDGTTGTGSVVLSVSPSFTGNPIYTSSGALIATYVSNNSDGGYFVNQKGVNVIFYFGDAKPIGMSGSPSNSDAGLYSTGDIYLEAAGHNNLLWLTGTMAYRATSAPGAGLSGAAQLWAQTISSVTELRVMDSAGNITTLSEHATDAPEWLYDDDDQPQRVSREANIFAGKIRFVNRTRAARLQECLFENRALPPDPLRRKIISEETFDQYNSRLGLNLGDDGFLVQQSWEANEELNYKRREDERASWQAHRKQVARESVLTRLAKGQTAAVPEVFHRGPQPEPYKRRPRPKWLK